MSTKYIVKFDNNTQGIYQSGELLSGFVELITVKTKTIRAIHVSINGYAKVRWKQQRTQRVHGNPAPHTVVYCSNQQYLAKRTYVVGEEGGDSFELPAGAYLYRFQLQLPPELPSSFEGQYGHICYEVITRVDRPFKFDNIFKQPFTIIAPFDLNLDPVYKLGKERCVEKPFFCGLCGSRTLTAKVNIPVCGYAPGQNINFILGIDNASSVSCTDVLVTLEKTACYISHYPVTTTRYDNVKITEKSLGPMVKKHQKELRDFITIPCIPPTSPPTEACKIIQVSYRLNFDFKMSGCHRDLDMSLPVTIGTIPIFETDVIRSQPSAPSLSLDIDNYSLQSGNMPPSYEDAIKMGHRFVDEDEEKHKTESTFMPKYPVYYNWKTPSP